MAVGGAKPKPAALKDLHGTARRDRRKAEPKPSDEALSPPRELAAIAGARRYWDHIVRTAPLGMLKAIDSPLLAKLCIELAIGDRAVRALRKGFVIETGNGTLVQSPWVGILHRSTEIARKLASELALPVTARARIDAPDLPPPPPGDTDDEPPRRTRSGDDLDAFLDQHPDRTLN